MSPTVAPAFRTTQHHTKATKFSWDDPAQRNPAILLILLIAGLVIAYWNMLSLTSMAWANPLYSHGWLIPLLAFGLFWLRREPFQWLAPSERWIGLGILAAGLVFRAVAAIFDLNPVDRLSFLVCLAGAFVLVGGWNILRWAGPAIAFLMFMFPLPNILEKTIHPFLQGRATQVSTYALQTMGISAYRSGNVITIPGVADNLTVAEQCSGLRMLTIFCALAVAMVFLIDRPWWDKLTVLICAVPIAILSNIVRIILTALFYMVTQDEAARKLAHDVSGLLMMVWGLGFLWLEFQILSRITTPLEDAAHIQSLGASQVAMPTR